MLRIFHASREPVAELLACFIRIPSLILIALFAVACSSALIPATDGPDRQESPPPPQNHQETVSYGFTHQNPDGNRWVGGTGAMPHTTPLDIQLEGIPQWVVSAPWPGGSLWIAVLEDGTAQPFAVVSGTVTHPEISPNSLPPGMPPLLKVRAGAATLLPGTNPSASTMTHPVPWGDPESIAYVNIDGSVSWTSNAADQHSIASNALPDSRLLVDGSGSLVWFSGVSDHYGHGVLGDRLEATTLSRLHSPDPVPANPRVIRFPRGDVAEGIAPILADINGDGIQEILVTLSNSNQGARLAVFDFAGNLLAESPAIGRGGRWRHQLAIAPFGPSGEMEISDILTPHLGGIVEYFRWEGTELKLTAQLPGFSSHILGSRNLDMALAGDLDGDGQVELLVPTQDRSKLVGIRRTADGAAPVWELALDGRVTSNIAAVTRLEDDALGVGVGTSSGVLRLWLP